MANHRRVIDDNIVSLCDYTKSTVRLVDKLMEKKILTRDESRGIKRQLDGYERNRALYEALRRIDGDAFSTVVLLMETREMKQSNQVLKILKTVTVKEVATENKRENIRVPQESIFSPN